MASGVARKTGKKNRKFGRNKLGCKAYLSAARREHNKVRRLRRHLKKFPQDSVAAAAVDRCKTPIQKT